MAKLLVVDDEAAIRLLIRKYAEYEGHSVQEAADGMEAVRMARGSAYDAIIMDIVMPELDGFSSADQLTDIWQRYYKVDAQHKRSIVGSGLGLSIVRGILELHHARYGVESEVGKGKLLPI